MSHSRKQNTPAPVYIAMDYMNAYLELQRDPETRIRDEQIRLNTCEMMRIISNGRQIDEGCVFTSGVYGKVANAIKNQFRHMNLQTSILRKNADDQIIRYLKGLIFRSMKSAATIILVTGDGNDHDGWFSFPKVIRHGLLNNPQLKVELWAWSHSCKSIYKKWHKKYARFNLKYFDQYRPQLIYQPHETPFMLNL